MATQLEVRSSNECFVEGLRAGGELRKEAADAGAKVTGFRIRENSFIRKLIDPQEYPDTAYNRFPHDDKPSITFDFEPDSMMAVGVPFNGQPPEIKMMARRYLVVGQRVETPRVVLDEMQLKTYRFDVKEIFANNLIRDALAFEDQAGIAAVNTLMGAAVNTTLPSINRAGWIQIGGGITRENIVEGSLQTIQYTKFHIPTVTCVTNAYTLGQFAKWGRDEAGGDMAEQTIIDGWMKKKVLDKTWLGTIKSELVPNFRIYHFGPENFLGNSVLFKPPTMYVEEKKGYYTFELMYVLGTVFAHQGAMAIVDHGS